jgi:hypothetical protein
MIATLSADIVRSTSLRTEDLIDLRKKLLGFFDDLGDDYPGFWGRIVRGDSIECFIPDYHAALRIAVLIKLFIKKQIVGYECSALLQRIGIRFSIGIGEIRYVDRTEDIIDGPAIYISGRNLDAISRKNDSYSVIEVDGASRAANCFLDSYVAMASGIVDAYSNRQAEVVFYKMLGFKEREIGERLGIQQSSVNMRATGANWGLLNTAIKDFENFNIEELCG